MQRKVRNPKKQRWLARRRRVLKQIERSDRVRLTVYRSLRHIYALLVDPETGRTITSVSTRTPAVAAALKSAGQKSTGNVEAARAVGKAVAELARSKGIEKVVFNRNGYLYHGRVKALAEAAREAGLDF